MHRNRARVKELCNRRLNSPDVWILLYNVPFHYQFDPLMGYN